MANLSNEQKRAELNGDVIATTVGQFKGAVRSLENQGLEAGDTWTFPSDGYKICTTTIGNSGDVEYIWIELENGNAKKFFPGTFTKSRGLFEMDDKLRIKPVMGPDNKQIRKKTEGTAAEEFRKHTSINDAMNALAGKKVTVSKVETAKTQNYNNPSQLQNTQFYTIDFVK